MQSRPYGYTKAVDMWSLGCITFTLLTGYPWPSDFSDPQVEEVFDNCRISYRARDFIKRLLVIDDRLRMSTKEALAHGWFTNRSSRAALERLYKRCIADWKPRVREGEFVLNIDDLVREKLSRNSKWPAVLSPSASPQRLNLQLSQTLSDLHLPPHSRKITQQLAQETSDNLEDYVEFLISSPKCPNSVYHFEMCQCAECAKFLQTELVYPMLDLDERLDRVPTVRYMGTGV